jgi:NUMOD3 motif
MVIYKEFCVYLTKYNGHLMPPMYIGSRATIDVLENSYFGTVTSSKYKKIWKEELKQNPELFSVEIISCHDTRQEALDAEEQFQRLHDAVNSDLYINQAYANKKFSNLGKKASDETRKKLSQSHKGKKFTAEHRQNLSDSRKGKDIGSKRTEETKQKMREAHEGKRVGENNNFYGKTHSDETKQKIAAKNIDKKLSEETKRRIGESRKLAHAKKKMLLFQRSQ